jgi:aryl-alcohol dehydrogenase-like predicted oxidoreductase
MERACQIAGRSGLPGPAATQPPYSLVSRAAVEDPAMAKLAAERQIAIVASYSLAGGVLTGKYDQDPQAGRAAGELDQPRYLPGIAAGRQLAELSRQIGRDPAHLAMAFALLNPSVTTVLFGATRPEQIWSNLTALTVAGELTPAERAGLTAIGAQTSDW